MTRPEQSTTSTRHTPSPWRYGRYSSGHGGHDGPIRIWGPRGEVLADVPLLSGEANARLMAAAPELVDMLRLVLLNAEPLGDGYTKVCTLDIEAADRLLVRLDKEDEAAAANSV